ncbi:hypothetical protein SK128_014665 [Halocaridina rubra]|uniref:RING-CH-type domain-containing protein n=1 Tax=Halocaridina rubra TaxID=373956 RepID=A0AAN9A874_HALRR
MLSQTPSPLNPNSIVDDNGKTSVVAFSDNLKNIEEISLTLEAPSDIDISTQSPKAIADKLISKPVIINQNISTESSDGVEAPSIPANSTSLAQANNDSDVTHIIHVLRPATESSVLNPTSGVTKFIIPSTSPQTNQVSPTQKPEVTQKSPTDIGSTSESDFIPITQSLSPFSSSREPHKAVSIPTLTPSIFSGKATKIAIAKSAGIGIASVNPSSTSALKVQENSTRNSSVNARDVSSNRLLSCQTTLKGEDCLCDCCHPQDTFAYGVRKRSFQSFLHPVEHTEDNTSMVKNTESGVSPPQLDLTGENQMDTTNSNNNESSVSTRTAHIDGPVRNVAVAPAVTLTLESPPRCVSPSLLNFSVSPATTCQSSIGPMCRICHEGDSVEELISPCNCTGSLALVHKTCLERWLNMTNGSKCELCCHTLSISRTPRPFWQTVMCENGEARRHIIVDFLCFLSLTPFAVVCIYFCISAAEFYTKHSSYHASKAPSINKTERWKVALARSLGMNAENGTTNSDLSSAEKRDEIVSWDIIGVVMLAFLLSTIYISWLVATIIFHVKSYQRWRNVNQHLVLVNSQPPISIERHRRTSCFSLISQPYEQIEETAPHTYSVSIIGSPVDLSFFAATRDLDRDTEDSALSNSGSVENTPGIYGNNFNSRDRWPIENTPAVSEKYLSLSNLDTPYRIVLDHQTLEEVNDYNVFDCISLYDPVTPRPELENNYSSTDLSLPRYNANYYRARSVSAENYGYSLSRPLSPCIPRHDVSI